MEELGRGPLLVDTQAIIADIRSRQKSGSTLWSEARRLYFPLFGGRVSDMKPFISQLNVLDFTREIAECAAEIATELKLKNRLPKDPRDIFIGATARYHGLPVLTRNTNHFTNIDGLEVISNL